jgi:predicted dehydrogenase
MTERLRFGLAGAGGIGQAYGRIFQELEEGEMVGVADVRLEAAQALGEALRCRSYGSYQEMAAQVDLDVVLICTPPVSHFEISVWFLERKIHVLCEKPLTLDRGSARMMLEQAERYGVQLAMASKFRYVEDVVRAKSILLSGILGEIVWVDNSFTSHTDMAGRWNADAAVSGGGVLIDNGTHSVDLVRYLVGPIREVLAVEGRRTQGLPVEETARMLVRCENGALGNIDLSWSIQRPGEYYASVCGSRGSLLLGWKDSRYRELSRNEWAVFGAGYNRSDALRNQVKNFIQAVRGEEPLRTTPEDALASVEVIAAAYASLRRNAWQPVQGGRGE